MSRRIKLFYLSVALTALFCQTLSTLAKPEVKSKAKVQVSKSKGELAFASHCASCHANGGNIVRSEKPVAGSSYLSNYVSFKNYLKKPIGTMPHYENLIKNDKVLKELYRYVKTLNKSDIVGS